MSILAFNSQTVPGQQRSIGNWDNVKGTVTSLDRMKGKPEAIVSMSITQMELTYKAVEKWPDVPLFCYNWDCYEWVWSNPRQGEYDYNQYGELLKRATEIWVPSRCTGLRTSEWWKLNNWRVILSSAPYWDYENIRDDGYALCCLREIPDPWWGEFEKACEYLDIPYKMTKHEVEWEEYQDLVAGCRFICAPLHELSTGGLSLLEAYYLGKPVLINDSQWNGGVDYFRGRANYFDGSTNTSLKLGLQELHEDPFANMPHDYREYVANNFSNQRMIDNMLERIRVYSD
jgi:glycosyltransferase involved in cell wall biosynthesis